MDMQRIQRKAFMGLVVLGLVGAVPAMAQDTTTTQRTPQPGQQGTDSLTMPGQGGAADTAGFSGMERNDPTGARADTSAGAGQDTSGVETGAVRSDTGDAQRTEATEGGPVTTGAPAGQSRDPNGFRWTEPSDFANAGQTPPVGATDAVQPNRQTEAGEAGEADTSGDAVQNPPGFRGLERDTTQVPPGAAPSAETPTSRTEQMERQAETGDTLNPPGYRGMEKPAGKDKDKHKAHADSTKDE
jgi:hypothetical protein